MEMVLEGPSPHCCSWKPVPRPLKQWQQALFVHTPLDTVWTQRGVNEAGWRGTLHFSSLTLRRAVLGSGPGPVNQITALLCINTFHPQSAREAGAGDLVTVSWTI